MDEAALRAMMPSSFGRRGAGKGTSIGGGRRDGAAAVEGGVSGGTMGATKPGSVVGGGALGSSVLGKRIAAEANAEEDAENQEEEEDDDDDDDDGLTAEERAANREAERRERERRARGIGSDDDDSDDDSDDSDDDIGPPLPPPASAAAAEHTPSSSPSTRGLPETSVPPTTHTASFTGTHTKTLSALAVDASGSRFCLGSYDSTLSLYDFGGMTSALQPFRHFAPTHETYPLLDLSFSSNRSQLLVVSGTSQAKVYTRDGAELATCAKGDPYLRDMRHTKGHVSALTCGVFDPLHSHKLYTGGSDSTVRIWDAETLPSGQQDLIVLKSRNRGGRTKVTALQCKGDRIWASGQDGSLAMWDLRENLNGRPRASVDEAHERETWTSCIAVQAEENGGEKLVTRGGDGTVKVWDARSFKKPVVERRGLANGSSHTGVIWDPFNSRSLITCVVDDGASGGIGGDDDDSTSAGKKDGGRIVVLDSLDLSTVHSVATASTPVRLHWSGATDQLFATHRSGALSLFYSPSRSTNGITLALARNASSSHRSLYTSTPSTAGSDSYPVTSASSEPGASQSESAKRRRLAKDRHNAQRTLLPQMPLEGRGRGGRIGAGQQQGTVQQLWKAPDDLGVDPREALLKYAADAQHEQHFTKAWQKTQPKTIYAEYNEEQQEGEQG